MSDCRQTGIKEFSAKMKEFFFSTKVLFFSALMTSASSAYKAQSQFVIDRGHLIQFLSYERDIFTDEHN